MCRKFNDIFMCRIMDDTIYGVNKKKMQKAYHILYCELLRNNVNG